MAHDPHYWFPVRRFGWGWGFPSTWQGWVVFVSWLIVEGAAVLAFGAERPVAFGFCTLAATVVFVAICLQKGAPPSWRWGGRS